MFNPDGSLKAKRIRREHLPLLRALDEIPFSLGKKLLTEHLQGKENAKTARLRLNRFFTFGELGGYDSKEINKLIDFLKRKNFIATKKEKGLYPVIVLTEKGKKELQAPKEEVNINNLDSITRIKNPFSEKTTITEKEKKLFEALDDFLGYFNDEQKKAIIDPSKHILCVAGAGSGKTSVLTKRIEFLTKYKGVNQEKILAITFSRKARREMQDRLQKMLPKNEVKIETFNSFCEKLLQKHGHLYYDTDVSVINNKNYLVLVMQSLKKFNHTPATVVKEYFPKKKKDERQLFFSFLYDLRTLVDRIKVTSKTVEDLRKEIKGDHSRIAHLLLDIAEDITHQMKEAGLRDFTDQLLDAINLLKQYPETTPTFDHILVDEYQDVNDIQLELIELLKPKNLFVVGDPRQSIYGWRGSKISHILSFPEKYNCSVIQLTKNYRSSGEIVDLCNKVIASTGYTALETGNNLSGAVGVRQYISEDEQASTIIQDIKSYEGDKKEIFVLARTNKALEKIQEYCKLHNINYIIRTEERKRASIEAEEGQITLATVHAVKGLEASRVYVINTNTLNFPCKASDHPAIELFDLHDEEYDTYAEELRVLYVALSRAKKELFVTYTGNLSSFMPKVKTQKKKVRQSTDEAALLMRLRQWRYEKAKEKNCPAYVICNDKTLHALIASMPVSEEELFDIHGLGKARIDEFGDEILSVLQ